MARNWEATRERVRQWYALVERCRVTLTNAQQALGADLGGFSPVDLLLDNHPELKSVREARNALDYIAGRKGKR